MKKLLVVFCFALLLVSSVSASTLSTGDSSSSSGGSDNQPSSSSGAGGASSKKLCLSHWTTYDGGKTWDRRDVAILHRGKIKIIDGNKCLMNQPLAEARVMYKTGYSSLYERFGPIEQSMVWTEASTPKSWKKS